ncbi:MAG: hypothetical protein ABSA67_15305 [Candidatus Brocadiia bacterium]|jgi:glycosyltransferase involved in cell wall biosynthesis
MSRTAVCTIASKNYLHYCRTLMDSVRRVHPDWEQHLLLADEVQGAFDPAAEKFNVVEVARLPLPQPRKFFFRYTILELNTAVKPWLLDWLLHEKGYDRVLYLDPDIRVYGPLTEVGEALDAGANMVLTPHLTGRLDDARRPTEQEIMLAGAYNLGFIALRRADAVRDFLRWWQSKLEYACVVDLDAGLFVDQKWMDLAPGMFPGVFNLRHEGYNVAYWNLKHRKVTKEGNGFRVNGQPLKFFHYSGLNPEDPSPVSKHQDRFKLADLGDAEELVRDYCRAVIAHGMAECRTWKYAFGSFADGAEILDAMRLYYRNHPERQADFGDDPFQLSHDYFNRRWSLGRETDALVTILMRAVWEARRDLQIIFPDIAGSSRQDYAYWFSRHIAAEMKIPDVYVEPVRGAFRSTGPRALKAGGARMMLRSGSARLKAALSPRTKARIKAVLRGVKRVSPQRLADYMERTLPMREPVAPLHPPPRVGVRMVKLSSLAEGVNLVGYFALETGVGQSARNSLAAVRAAELPHSVVDAGATAPSLAQDYTCSHRIAGKNPYSVNLFHVNADQFPVLYDHFGSRFFEERYNVGYMHWELAEFPDEVLNCFALLDEAWAPSRFVMDALAEKSPVPVVRIPHAISFALTPGVRRSDFDLPADAFLFLMMYDMRSFQARKNPEAAIAAFEKAFAGREQAALVIKISNGREFPGDLARLQERMKGNPGIRLIDQCLSRQQMYDLESVCDAFLSLHRSEGFGLGLAESMFLGKPAVGTNWSGNTDFMDARNSCPVDCTLVTLAEDCGPYKAGQRWADPDVDHAAWYLRKLVDDPAWRRRIAEAGRKTITEEFSPQAVGRSYGKRLDVIFRLLGGERR